jgi:hypothetical protein
VFSWWSFRLVTICFFSKDSFPSFTRLNPCVAHCLMDSIPWVLKLKGGRVPWLRRGIYPLANPYEVSCEYTPSTVASATGSGWHRLSLEVIYPRRTGPRLPVGAARFRPPCDGSVAGFGGFVGCAWMLRHLSANSCTDLWSRCSFTEESSCNYHGSIEYIQLIYLGSVE